MRQITTHKRVGDVEHARTDLRGQPHEFAQYQFHLDKLHAKRIARERRKEAAGMAEMFPFAHTFENGKEMNALDAHFSGRTTEEIKAGPVRDRNDVETFLKESAEEEAKLAAEGITMTNTPRAGDVDERILARAQRLAPGFYERAAKAAADTMDELIPIMRDGRVIGVVSGRDVFDPTAVPELLTRLRSMVARDDVRQRAEKVDLAARKRMAADESKPIHGGYPSR